MTPKELALEAIKMTGSSVKGTGIEPVTKQQARAHAEYAKDGVEGYGGENDNYTHKEVRAMRDWADGPGKRFGSSYRFQAHAHAAEMAKNLKSVQKRKTKVVEELDEGNNEFKTKALAKSRYHKDKFEHHEAAREHGNFDAHDHAAGLHFDAYRQYRKAARHYHNGEVELGHRAVSSAREFEGRAQTHKQENEIDEGFVSKAAGIAARVAVPQFGDIAQAGAEYAAERGEDFLRKKLHRIGKGVKSGAKFVKRLTGDKPVTEATRKDEVDDIGRYHSSMANVGKVQKGSPAAEYHAIQRNRASRLKNMRDHTGPNAPATKHKSGRQMMLKFAGEDSRAAKIAKAKITKGQYVKENLTESESAHKTHPLPNKHGDGYAVYDHPEGSLKVSRLPSGHYVADIDNRYGVHKETADGMRDHLKKMDARYVGWDGEDD